MSDFSVKIRKKSENGHTYSDKSTNNNQYPKMLFYDRGTESFEEVEYLPTPRSVRQQVKAAISSNDILNSSLTNKSFLRTKISSRHCPVCFDVLDDRVKRVYSKRIEGKVYLPFIDFSKRDGVEKVKLCYPCYKHVVTQWKEYNRSEVPHEERVYWDRHGNFIPSSPEENEMRFNRMIKATNRDVVYFDDDSDVDSKITSNEEVFYVPRKSQVYQSGLVEYNFDDLLSEVNRQIGRIEVSTRISLNKTRKEIERIIEKHNRKMQNEITELRNNAEFTQVQVDNIRKHVNGINDHKGPLLKRRRKKALSSDFNEQNLSNRKPFL